MTTQEIADRLVELSRQGDWTKAHNELYAQNAVSVEPEGTPWQLTEGLEQINKKGEEWANGIEEIHKIEVSDPVVANDFFSCTMLVDSTMKDWGRQTMHELCVYKVKDGKVVSEQFFYTPQQPS